MVTKKDKTILERDVFHAFSAVEDDENEWTVGEEMNLDQYVTFIRASYNDGADTPTELSDDEIKDAIRSVEGDTAEAEVERIAAVEASSTGEEPEEEDETAGVSAQRSAGREVGAKLDAEAMEHLSAIDVAKQVRDGSALFVALDFERIYTPEERAAWPVPGSAWDDDDRVKAAAEGRAMNTQPDHYKDGRIRGSHYADMYDGCAHGRHNGAVRQCLAKVKNGEKWNADETRVMRDLGFPNPAIFHDKDVRESEEQKWSSMRTNMVTTFRRAATYLFHADEMNSKIKGLSVDLVQDPLKDEKTGKINPASPILRKTNCLKITWVGVDENKKRKVVSSSAMSINKFNRLLIGDKYDDKKKKTNRGALWYIANLKLNPIAALEKTVERPPGSRRKSLASGLTIPTANVNGNMAFSMFAGLRSFFQDMKKDPKIGVELANHFTGDNSSQEILSLGDLKADLDAFFAPYKQAYDTLKDQELDRLQQEGARRAVQTGETLTPAERRRRAAAARA